MQINPQIVKKQFEKSLEKYSENAVVQKIMAQKLVDLLPENYFSKILELGCGAGILTEEIVYRIKFDKYFANDLIPQSKKYIDKIIPESSFITGNAQKITINSKVDLVISNAMFQWLKRLDIAAEHFKTFLDQIGRRAHV